MDTKRTNRSAFTAPPRFKEHMFKKFLFISQFLILNLSVETAPAQESRIDDRAPDMRLQVLIQQDGYSNTVKSLEKTLENDPSDTLTLRMLHLALIRPHKLNRAQSLRMRNLVGKLSSSPKTILTPPEEPGQPLIVMGSVCTSDGEPVEGATVYVFQTDAAGYYTPSDSITGNLDEPNSRLFGYMKTGANGHYQFRTVRPGGYPEPRKDLPNSHPMKFIPQHIHFEISAPGYATRRLQMVFEDDPRMNSEWQKWAKKHGHPVVPVTTGDDGFQQALCTIILP